MNASRQSVSGLVGKLSGWFAGLVHTHVKADVADLEVISSTPGTNTIVKSDSEGSLISSGWIYKVNEFNGVPAQIVGTDENGYIHASLIEEVNVAPQFPQSIPISDDETGFLSPDYIPPLPLSKLDVNNQNRILGTADTGVAVELTPAQVKTILSASVTVAADSIPISKAAGSGGKLALGWIPPDTGPAILTTDNAGNVIWVGNAANAPLVLIGKTVGGAFAFAKFSGTAWPSAPADGQWFTRTDHGMMYRYSTAAGGWLSVDCWTYGFSVASDVSTSIYLIIGAHAPSSGGRQYTDVLGPFLGFAVKVVAMRLAMTDSGSCAVQVFDDGAAVTNGALTLTTQTKKSDELMMSDAIATDSILGVKRTSGTIEGPATGTFTVRRFET